MFVPVTGCCCRCPATLGRQSEQVVTQALVAGTQPDQACQDLLLLLLVLVKAGLLILLSLCC